VKLAACGAAGMMGLGVFDTSVWAAGPGGKRPNILFAIADDWAWPHASIVGAPEVRTPAFDYIAKNGCIFTNAFTAAPQCSPNRAATLTGRSICEIEEAGTHGSIFPNKFAAFTDVLENSGYHVGFTGKGWAPGDWKAGGWKRNPAGDEYNELKKNRVAAVGINGTDYAGNFKMFLDDREPGEPFFFWYGGFEPHRSYEPYSGQRRGKKVAENVNVPSFLPDVMETRQDLLDYFFEVEWFDRQLGKMISLLDKMGELENTIIVSTGDNGMPFPRAKANLYEYGTHVPLAVSWPAGIKAGCTVDALFSFTDFAPTFLEAAGAGIPEAMSGRSFYGLLSSPDPEAYAAPRDFVLTGRERHSHSRKDNLGYPARALRTDDYLYIRNFKPDRWPAGDPDKFYDIDDSPTKNFLLKNREEFAGLYDMAVGKRKEEELFDIKNDPECMNDLAASPEHEKIRTMLARKLEEELKKLGDPRVLGTGDIFDSYPRVSHMRGDLGGFAEQGKYNPAYIPK